MEKKEKILCVDDEKQIVISLRALLRSKYEVLTATSGEEALGILRNDPTIRVIISDQRMPKMLGAEVLREARKISPGTMRLLLTGYSDLQATIDSINEGEVFRFINKPWINQELRMIVDLAVEAAVETEQAVVSFSHEIEPEQKLAVDAASQGNSKSTEVARKPLPRETSHHTSDKTKNTGGPGILVVDDEKDTILELHKIVHDAVSVYSARTISDAIEILGDKEIAVIISETIVANEDATEFVKLLKKHYPSIITIILTKHHGIDSVISLINQGQIYRYSYKPIKHDQLEFYIKLALNRYGANIQKPELLKRHQVEEIKEVKNPSLVGKLIGRLKSLRLRLGFAS
ncbi:MAG: response regulator [Candidatus Competibacter sp.]